MPILKSNIKISDFTYDLPKEKIASYPLDKRDSSKLLIYNKGEISHSPFSSLPYYLSKGNLMIFNNTKVVPARLIFRKETGAFIEIFCLEPYFPEEYNTSFASQESCSWRVIVGNIKRWKEGKLSFYTPEHSSKLLIDINLKAELIEREDEGIIVRFTWNGGIPFSELLEMCGKVPIPPYLNRESEALDSERYQTLYAKYRGSVAAPTAGLHFTKEVLEIIKANGVDLENICLHVGAGTFLPVKSEHLSNHTMHCEPFSVSLSLLRKIYGLKEGQKIISVGTTSARTLESLYYLGCQALEASPSLWTPHTLEQWTPYNISKEPPVKEALGALIEYLEINHLEELKVKTQIIILPPYRFKIIDLLITNFHQPQSTLLLLIAAFVGEENWRSIYDYALNNDFRFLSYGDSSLLIR